jgi:hypothetical protein
MFDYRVRQGSLSDWLHTEDRMEKLTARIQAKHRRRRPWRWIPCDLRRQLFSAAGRTPWAPPDPSGTARVA